VAGRDSNGLIQDQNFSRNRLLGTDAELSAHFRGLDIGGSIALQNDYDTTSRNILPNSPKEVSKVRIAVPLLRNRLTASGSLNWLSRRREMHGSALSAVLEPDITLATGGLGHGFDVQFGVRNLFNQAIHDPVALNDFIDVMPRPGRTLFVRMIWRTND
jgi:hypothetical protein